MDDFENTFDDTSFDGNVVIPNAAIIKFRDGTYHCIKFSQEDTKMIGHETEITTDGVWDTSSLSDLNYDQIAFVKIMYEFDYDAEQGIMEMELCESLTLTDINDEFVYIEDIYKNKPEDIIAIYIDLLDNFH